jgi:transcriptional regulator of NAD metabolism
MEEEKEGVYVYCIIEADGEKSFGSMGIGGRGDQVYTICLQGLAAVVSDTPIKKYSVSRENMMAHEKAIEEVMQDHTVLPVVFSTIAASSEDVQELLRARYAEFKNMLKEMEGKVELGVRALWKNKDMVFQEIVEENGKIKRLKEAIATKSPDHTYAERVRIGEMVKAALESKREKEEKEIIKVLKEISVQYRTHKVYGDSMIMNAAFLVDRAREGEFDRRMEELTTKYEHRIGFKYVGPAPPYNFVNIVVAWR